MNQSNKKSNKNQMISTGPSNQTLMKEEAFFICKLCYFNEYDDFPMKKASTLLMFVFADPVLGCLYLIVLEIIYHILHKGYWV